MMRIQAVTYLVWLSCLAFLPPPALAQDATSTPAAASTSVSAPPPGGIEVNADQLEYEADRKMMTGRGNVVVKRDHDTLKADFMTVNTESQEAHAVGNVTFLRGSNVWHGSEITYNFKTQQGNFGAFNAYTAPFYIRATDSRRESNDVIVLKNVTITTCEGDNPDFYIRAREATICQQDHVYARGAVFYFGSLPIFYVPYWSRGLGGDPVNVDVVPGWGSHMGPFLLTAYNYRLSDTLRASTHLDYRFTRGPGVGQDLLWGDKNLSYHGSLKTYYTYDQEPLASLNDAEKAAYSNLVSNDRYRLRLSDVHELSPSDSLFTELNYVSDPMVLSDFFDQEYKNNVQPENRISLVHRADTYTASLELNRRLNDFYDNVDRLPEARLEVPRLQLGQSPLYYESVNSATFLQKEFAQQSNQDSYDAFRVDSEHTIYYPTRHFDFLNVTPRVGYRATYYSKTVKVTTVTNLVTTVDTNGVPTTSNQVSTVTQDESAKLRNVAELGFETSFKAFNVIHNDWISRDDQGLRHVAEPYALYTYIPKPDVTPDALLQFDEVDQVNKTDDLLFGMRNSLQTKRRGQVHDLVYLDVNTTYHVEKVGDEQDFSGINFNSQFSFVDWLPITIRGSYDPYNTEVTNADAQVTFIGTDMTRVGIDYVYQKDSDLDQVATTLQLFPNRQWSFNTYHRYSFQTDKLEEQSYFVSRKGSCLGYGVGVRDQDGTITLWGQIWLLAFPKSSIGLGR